MIRDMNIQVFRNIYPLNIVSILYLVLVENFLVKTGFPSYYLKLFLTVFLKQFLAVARLQLHASHKHVAYGKGAYSFVMILTYNNEGIWDASSRMS